MTRSMDLAAPRTGGEPLPPVSYHQGIVEAYDPDTGANAVLVAGSVLADLPVLGVTDALGLQAGNVVSVLHWRDQYWLIGRIGRPGTTDFGQLIVRSSNGAYIQLIDGGLRFIEGSVAGQIPGSLIPFSPGSGEVGLQITPPSTSGAANATRIILGGATVTGLGGIEAITRGHALLWSEEDLAWIRGADNAIIETTGSPGDVFLSATGSVVCSSTLNQVFVAHSTTASAANCRLETTGLLARSTSSRRYKQDIADLVVDPAVVLRMRPRTWRERMPPPAACPTRPGARAARIPPPRAAPEQQPRTGVGFVAEELADLGLEQFVEHDEQGRPDAIAYDRLSAALLVVLKDQQRQIAALTRRVSLLEGES
jgi:hypothetical protein